MVFLYLWQVEATLYLQCTGFSLQWLLLLQIIGAGHSGSIVVVLRLSCPTACGIVPFPDQGLNLCPLYWQVDSLPLDHQGSSRVHL